MGDYNGIGPEIAIKAFSRLDLTESTPVWIGSSAVFDFYRTSAHENIPCQLVEENTDFKPGYVHILDPFADVPVVPEPGKLTGQAGEAAMLAIQTGAELCIRGLCHALVTAPISKEAIFKAGFNFPGHTEFLAHLTKTEHVMMMLVNDQLRVALATIHIPLKDVSGSITTELIKRQLRTLHTTLIQDSGISIPKIAVLGLNPHAGDGGVIGTEESKIIQPAIRNAADNGIYADGPFAADGFFGSHKYKEYDAILAMYHDQGLIPFKTLSFGKGVNFTANLSIIRTSPDHGTAYQIAGNGVADESSFLEAYNLAVYMAKKRFGEPVE